MILHTVFFSDCIAYIWCTDITPNPFGSTCGTWLLHRLRGVSYYGRSIPWLYCSILCLCLLTISFHPYFFSQQYSYISTFFTNHQNTVNPEDDCNHWCSQHISTELVGFVGNLFSPDYLCYCNYQGGQAPDWMDSKVEEVEKGQEEWGRAEATHEGPARQLLHDHSALWGL